MSNIEAFDLGMRLRAAASGTVQPRTVHTTVIGGLARRVAVHCTGDGTVTVHPAGGKPRTAEGVDGLRLLSPYAPPESSWSVAVVLDRHVLTRLHKLARDHVSGDPELENIGLLVNWWLERSEHPGTQAVVEVLSACRTRWVTGQTTSDERNLDCWRRWLDVSATGTHALHDIADLLADGVPNPLLDENVRDGYRWRKVVASAQSGWSMTIPESTAQMAVGLASREAAEDEWNHALLSDPGVEARERHTGRVVTGHVRHTDGVRVVIDADTSCRHKKGRTVRVRIDDPDLAARLFDADEEPAVTARFLDIEVVRTDDGDKTYVTVEASGRGAMTTKPVFAMLSVGDHLTVLPDAVDPDQNDRSVHNVADLHRSTSSWTRVSPKRQEAPRTRRNVPLAVLALASGYQPPEQETP